MSCFEMCQVVGLRIGFGPQPQGTDCSPVSVHPVSSECLHLGSAQPRDSSRPSYSLTRTGWKWAVTQHGPATLGQWHLTWGVNVVYRKTPEGQWWLQVPSAGSLPELVRHTSLL